MRVLDQALSGKLTCLQAYKYVAFTAGGLRAAFDTIYDTGMSSPNL